MSYEMYSSLNKKTFALGFAYALLALMPTLSFASGMVPETSMLFVNEANQGATMNVKNTDDNAQLLYTSTNSLPEESKDIRLIVTQPVARVEAGQTQQVRFVLQSDRPLKTEHMMRVIFEGIPQKTKGINKVGFNIRQDLPVLIHPAGLPQVQDAWRLLTWKTQGNMVTLSNTSPYVVRFQPAVELLPSKEVIKLSRAYILPGQTMTIDAGKPVAGNNQIRFSPVSRYGVEIDKYTAQLNAN